MAGVNPQHVLLLHHLRRFFEAAAEAGIEVAPLKGAHLITGVYPAGEDRGGMSDVDVLVRPADFEAAGELLRGLGYVRRGFPGRRRTGEDFHEVGYALELGGGRRVFLELHRYLIQPRRHPVDYGALWKRAERSTLDGAPCRRLAVEDHLLHAAIHLMTDRFTAPGRGLRDAEHLILRGGADLSVAAARAKPWRCARALWLTLSLLSEAAPKIGPRLAPHVWKLRPWVPVRAAARALVPGPAGLRWPELGTRAGQVLVWSVLLDGVGALGDFAAYYARMRLADYLERP